MAHRSASGAIVGGGTAGAGFAGSLTERLELAGGYRQPADSDAAARAAKLRLSRSGTTRAWRSGYRGDEFRQGHGSGPRGLRRLRTDGEIALAAKTPRRRRKDVSTGSRSRPEFDRRVERPRNHGNATETAVQSPQCSPGADRQISQQQRVLLVAG